MPPKKSKKRTVKNGQERTAGVVTGDLLEGVEKTNGSSSRGITEDTEASWPNVSDVLAKVSTMNLEHRKIKTPPPPTDADVAEIKAQIDAKAKISRHNEHAVSVLTNSMPASQLLDSELDSWSDNSENTCDNINKHRLSIDWREKVKGAKKAKLMAASAATAGAQVPTAVGVTPAPGPSWMSAPSVASANQGMIAAPPSMVTIPSGAPATLGMMVGPASGYSYMNWPFGIPPWLQYPPWTQMQMGWNPLHQQQPQMSWAPQPHQTPQSGMCTPHTPSTPIDGGGSEEDINVDNNRLESPNDVLVLYQSLLKLEKRGLSLSRALKRHGKGLNSFRRVEPIAQLNILNPTTYKSMLNEWERGGRAGGLEGLAKSCSNVVLYSALEHGRAIGRCL